MVFALVPLNLSQFLHAGDAAILTAPARLYAGSIASATVTTLDSVTREPRSLPFSLYLVSADSSRQWLTNGSTGPGGQTRVEFAVPTAALGAYKLAVDVLNLTKPVSISTTIANVPAILIETDKPIYKPSQVIQGRIVLLDSALRPRPGQVELIFYDGKGIRIARQKLLADQYGAAPFSLALAHEVNLGTWKVSARSEGAETARDVRVENYTLPRYDLKVEFPKSWALVDQPIRGTVAARYFFGKEVNGKVTISAKRWVGTWSEYAKAEGTLSAGRWTFELPPVGYVSGTLGAGGKGSVMIDISATDSTGQIQSITDALTITTAAATLNIIPRSKSLKPGLPAEIVITSQDPDGTPLSLNVDTTTRFISLRGVQIVQVGSSVATVNGIGTLRLVPPADTAYAEVTATTQVQGRKTSTTVRVGSAYTPSGSFLSLARVDSTGGATVGQTLTFSVLSTEPGTVYYEIYAGGRTLVSNATEGSTFSLVVTPDMMPRAKVVAYKITPFSEVTADSTSFDVALNVSVSLAASFSSTQVKPGDPVQVTIDAGTGRRALLGVSIVDTSILALGRSRLHLQQVFEELERRFLEPQAQVTDGGPVGGPPPILGVAPAADPLSVKTRGALDILKEAGLAIGVSENLVLPVGRDFGRFGPVGIDVSPAPAGQPEAAAPEPPRLRQFFPETWVWEPLLLTDESGKATLKLAAPDTITNWKLAVMGTCPDPSAKSGIGFGEADLTVFQDFFVEPSLPSSAVRGEKFSMKVDVFNYLDREQTVTLSLDKTKGLELEGSGVLSVKVAANSTASVQFPIRATELGDLPVKISAIGSSKSDAVLRQLTVEPEGIPSTQIANGVIRAGESAALEPFVSVAAVPDSTRSVLYVSPNPVAQTMKGVSDLLHMPYGCGEQNMIFLAPDIEILKYLREVGELAPEIRAKAEHFANVGYQRELTFQTDDGGFAAFGGKKGSLWLTAFVLSTFSGAREVRDIDEAVLAKAAGMLLSRQNADGSFQTDSFLIHTDMAGGAANLYTMTAYVTNALADFGGQQVASALNKAAGYLERSRTTLTGIDDSAYALAIAAVALQKVSGFENASEAIIDRLLQLAVRDSRGIYWKPYPVETTAYAAIALMQSNGGKGRPEVTSVLEWLSTQRNALGGYGHSTQDTVLALRALFLAARKTNRNVNLELVVAQGSRTVATIRVDATNFDILQQVELPASDGPFTLRATGNGSAVYQVATYFNIPGELLPPPRDMLLDVTYNTRHVAADNLVDVDVKIGYTGMKIKTGMVIADVGVPTGFEVVRGSLDDLVNAKIVQRVEVAGRKVIFYVDSLIPSKLLSFAFQIRALYPVKAQATVSRAYEYYDASVEAYHQDTPLTFGPGRSRVRP